MKPTEEQIKEFWEWCGFKQLPKGKEGFHFERGIKVMNWLSPNPDRQEWFYSQHFLPRIDLNNLFKWAVPKLLGLGLDIDIWNGLADKETRWGVGINSMIREVAKGYEGDPALALFWAIWEVHEEV